jgi:hypothetical protein
VKLEAVVPQERAKELVRRHTEPPIIESCKGHDISFHRCGEHSVLQHPTGPKLHCRHKPMLHEFLQMAQRNGGRSLVLLLHGSRRRRGSAFRTLVFLPISFFLFHSLRFFAPSFLFVRCLSMVRAASSEASAPRMCAKASLSSLLTSRSTNCSDWRRKTQILVAT